jgi:DNA-binding IclR family transcriptional regulator
VAPKALLSALTDAVLTRFFAENTERRTRHGALTEQEIRADIAEIRRRGYSLDREGLTAGVYSIGAVVRNSSGSPVCAISAAGLEHHYRGGGGRPRCGRSPPRSCRDTTPGSGTSERVRPGLVGTPASA